MITKMQMTEAVFPCGGEKDRREFSDRNAPAGMQSGTPGTGSGADRQRPQAPGGEKI